MEIKTLWDFYDALQRGGYVWPGGYPVFFVTADGGALSFATAFENRGLIADAIKSGENYEGWRVVATDVNWEDPDLFDDHSGNRIESAYAEDDAEGDYDQIPSDYKHWQPMEEMEPDDDFGDFFNSYLETAMWSSSFVEDGQEYQLDENYDITDIAKESLYKLQEDAFDFYTHHAHMLDGNYAQAGHDFWLTRNGHGAGFWDGDWPNGDELTAASKPYGTVDLYVGDDGEIYASGV